MATKNQPVNKIRFGRIRAVIWRNPGAGDNGPTVNTRLARLYDAPEADGWKEPQVKQEDCPDDRDPVLSTNPGDARRLLHISRAAGPV